MKNKQLAAAIDHTDSRNLLVHSVFPSIQGEGPFTGRPCIFIRLYGCNLSCPRCDTAYVDKCDVITVEELVNGCKGLSRQGKNYAGNIPLVVITGGEPFRQDISHLVNCLNKEGFHVQIETNGTIAPVELFFHTQTIVCSPKTPIIQKELVPYITCYKYVLSADNVSIFDGLPVSVLGIKAKPYRQGLNENKPIYVQPEYSEDPEVYKNNVQACVDVCNKFGYNLSLQIHKIIGVE